MATVQIQLSDDQLTQLAASAQQHETTPEALVARWVQERLVHERERAEGGGRPMSPRARRDQEGRD
jgi:hypothetical protein